MVSLTSIWQVWETQQRHGTRETVYQQQTTTSHFPTSNSTNTHSPPPNHPPPSLPIAERSLSPVARPATKEPASITKVNGTTSSPVVEYDAPVILSTSSPQHQTSTATAVSHNRSSSDEGGSNCSAPCVILLEERLVKTYPIWFLPDLQRSGAVHLLQGKDEGNFIVRQSSKPDTLALSVRLPPDKGPYIQHYLIEIHSNGSKYSLEASDNQFDNAPALIEYYSKCCDELPVQLRLPSSIQEARSRQELASIALLGQEFWGTVMASPTVTSPTASTPTTEPTRSNAPTPSPRPSDLSFSSFGKAGITRSSSNLLSPATPGMNGLANLLSPGTPLGTPVTPGTPLGNPITPIANGTSLTGSTSSLTPIRPAPPIPFPADRSSLNLNLNLEPLDEFLKEQPPTFNSFRSSQCSTPATPLKPVTTPGTKPTPPPRSSPPGTFRCSTPNTSYPSGFKPIPLTRQSPPCEVNTPNNENCEALQRLCQPPPVPPPRWARPTVLTNSSSNITVTTTLTLNVNQVNALPIHNTDQTPSGFEVHVASLEISPSGSNTQSCSPITPIGLGGAALNNPHYTRENNTGTLNSHRESLQLHIRHNITSPQSTPCTPCTPSTPLGEESKVRMRPGRKDRRRLSNHYHESNIIDNNTAYCRSSLADKISDYEDLWSSPPREIQTPTCEDKPKMSTFKPRNEISKSMGDLSDITNINMHVLFPLDNDVNDNKNENDNDSLYDNQKLNGHVNGNSNDSLNSYRKHSSPFYMEPADCVMEEPKARINKASSRLSRKFNRYSDSNIQWKNRGKSRISLGKIDSNEDLHHSSSFENLANANSDVNRSFESENNELNAVHLSNGHLHRDSRRHSRGSGRGKPVVPPRISGDSSPEVPWRVDSSWEFKSPGGSDGEGIGEGRFPVCDNNGDTDSVIIPGERTVQDLITERLPDFTFNDTQSIAPSHTTRISEYDNVGNQSNGRNDDGIFFHQSHFNNHQHPLLQEKNKPILGCLEERIRPPLPTHYFSSAVSDSGTEFSEPWDSRKWESMMHFEDDSSIDPRSSIYTSSRHPPLLEDSDIGGNLMTDTESIMNPITADSALLSDDETTSVSGIPTLSVGYKNLDRHIQSRIMSPQLLALRHRQDAESGTPIKEYAMDLGNDKTTTFSQAVTQFINCTLSSTERDPAIVVRNVRQFMSGMKNYLVTSGEKEFEGTVKKQRSNLKATEFLNLDAILEDVLVRLVLRPLWDHINKLFVDAYTANGSIQLLASNMKYARSQPFVRLGIRPELTPPSGAALETIKSFLTSMQRVYAPREKLEYLLQCVSHIYQAMYTSGDAPASGDADDLVPMIMWVLSQAGLVSAEVEADYMWGMLLPSASQGEASYYLTAFHSAIHGMQNLSPSPESSPGNSLDSVKQEVSVVSEQGVMKIVIPDEKNGSIITRTLPIRPGTTTREVWKMMAHKMKVTNPQDYGLYKLVDGHESLLADNECPHKVKSDLTSHGFHCTFAFKRMDAKIAWPILE
ncbi:unnamed protein product [Meganyctiphanes norvegica]|uniref:Protein sprint n=1 Tax=Meganyctiphanes norvegica TaxID=48144 RepID=A0AAV2RXK8_MEGNR